jgi:pimeloyl-ACP methyl ester carboxylesterase
MNKTRRHLAQAGLLASALGGTTPDAKAATEAAKSRPIFVLVHGAWHGAWCYGPLVNELAVLGYSAVAVDLPGHGLAARVPASWRARPFDAKAFLSERSAVAALTLEDYANRVVSVVDRLHDAGHQQIVLMGHSLGGVTVTRVAELRAAKLHRLVYLTAFMLAHGERALDAVVSPEGATAKIRPLVLADPAVVGASRIDPSAPDPAYQAQIRAAFFGDLDEDAARAAAQFLVPDESAVIGLTPTVKTAGRWGAVTRHYIKCLQDQALPLALQLRFIAAATA